jgi:hypothetical protein
MSTQMPADRPPPAVPGAGGEASYYDHEGRFWEGSNVSIHFRHSHCAHHCVIMLSTRDLLTQQGKRMKRRMILAKTNSNPLLNVAYPNN